MRCIRSRKIKLSVGKLKDVVSGGQEATESLESQLLNKEKDKAAKTNFNNDKDKAADLKNNVLLSDNFKEVTSKIKPKTISLTLPPSSENESCTEHSTTDSSLFQDGQREGKVVEEKCCSICDKKGNLLQCSLCHSGL